MACAFLNLSTPGKYVRLQSAVNQTLTGAVQNGQLYCCLAALAAPGAVCASSLLSTYHGWLLEPPSESAGQIDLAAAYFQGDSSPKYSSQRVVVPRRLLTALFFALAS